VLRRTIRGTPQALGQDGRRNVVGATGSSVSLVIRNFPHLGVGPTEAG